MKIRAAIFFCMIISPTFSCEESDFMAFFDAGEREEGEGEAPRCVRYVDENAEESGDGLSWETAHTNVEEAVSTIQATNERASCEVLVSGNVSNDRVDKLNLENPNIRILDSETKQNITSRYFNISTIDVETRSMNPNNIRDPDHRARRIDRANSTIASDISSSADHYETPQTRGACNCNYSTVGQNFGVGTSIPWHKLTVYSETGDAQGLLVKHLNGMAYYNINSPLDKNSSIRFYRGDGTQTGGDQLWSIYRPGGSKDLRFHSSMTGIGDMMTLDYQTGNIGIGTTNPEWGDVHIYENDSSGRANIYFAKNGTAAGWQIGQYVNNEFSIQSWSSEWKVARIQNTHENGATARLTVDGRLGIGMETGSPDARLDIRGVAHIDGEGEDAIRIGVDGESRAAIKFYDDDDTSDQQWFKIAWNADGYASDDKQRLIFSNKQSGDIASIGNNGLHVSGKISAEEIVVQQNITADYVFEDDYPLLSIEEVENYIEKNGHLPNVPGQDEVSVAGKNIGATQTKLLEKIEELTLYLIAQNKALKKQNSKIESQYKLISSQMDRIEKLEISLEANN